MDRKAQTLMVSLWILAILTILAVGIGHRVSMALRLSRYQKDKLKGLYLAKAGLNIAILEVEKDEDDFDFPNDSWSSNEEKFKKIAFEDKEAGYATVSYEALDENNEPKTIYGVIDEERYININTAPSGLLTELLERSGVIDASRIANNICAWRGDTGIDIPEYQDLGYTNKGSSFLNKEELLLVKDIDRGIYNKLAPLTTVWHYNSNDGYGKVNLNTTSKEILETLIGYCQKQLIADRVTENDPGDLLDRIMQVLPANDFNGLHKELSKQGLSSGQSNILNKLQKIIIFKSSCFYIKSSGKINDNYISDINCIFDRYNKKILYWHER
jgi:hypothetical protein